MARDIGRSMNSRIMGRARSKIPDHRKGACLARGLTLGNRCKAMQSSDTPLPASTAPLGRRWAWILPLLILLSGLLIPELASAQFLQRGLTYGDGSTFVVRVPLINGVRGIFVVSLPQEEPIQTFDLSELPDQAESLFLNVKEDGSFGSVTLPNGGQFTINGAVTLHLGSSTRIAIDGYYASIVSEKKEKEPSVIGFRGIEELFRFSGEQALLVEANRAFENDKRLAGMIRPYVVRGSELTIEGKRVSGQGIGITLDYVSKNRCFAQGARFVPRAAVEKVFLEKDPDKRRDSLKATIRENKLSNPLDDAVTIGASDKEIIAYAYAEGTFRIIRWLPTSAGEAALCSVAPLSLQ